jgi:SAM-dependent methyltransferase
MNNTDITIDFTGEFLVPGKSGERIEADHMARYHFACKFAQGKSILDIACGTGYSAPLFIKAGAVKYDGVDINEKLVKYANYTYGSDCVNYHVGDICSFNNAKSYDLITCYETIEHVENYEAVIRNLYSLLNHAGVLLISSPNRPITSPRCSSLHDKPANEFHVQEFIPEEILSILNNYGFVAGPDDIYGQRQRRVYSNILLNRIIRVVGNPDKKASPEVTPIREKVPRYFVIVATKT